MNNLLKFEKSCLYNINLICSEESQSHYVRGYIKPEQFSKLIFYLNEKLRSKLNNSTLMPIDIIDLLIRFYDFKTDNGIHNKVDATIELSDNWENHVSEYDDIINDAIYHVDGIEEALQDIVFDIVYTNPTVFYEKFLELIVVKDGVSYIPVPSRILDEVNEEKESK